MKRLIIFLLLFAAIKVAGQTTGYLRFDTVKIMKQNGTCELYIINATKDSLGLLTNVGGGLTRFVRSRVLNDSTLIVGRDTLVIKGGAGGSGGSGSADSTIFATNYRVDTAKTNLRTEIGDKVDGSGTAGRVTIWSGTKTVTSDAQLLYDATTNDLTTDSLHTKTIDADSNAYMPIRLAADTTGASGKLGNLWFDNTSQSFMYRNSAGWQFLQDLGNSPIPNRPNIRFGATVIRGEYNAGTLVTDWGFIIDPLHDSLFFDSISVQSNHIRLHYPTVSKVITFIAVPDEGLARYVDMGASVGTSFANLSLYRRLVADAGYVRGSGSATLTKSTRIGGWTASYTPTTGNVILTPNNTGTSAALLDGDAIFFVYSGNKNIKLKRLFSGLSTGQIGFTLTDDADNIWTDTLDTNDNIFIQTMIPRGDVISPGSGSTYNQTIFTSSSNIWLFAVFELDLKIAGLLLLPMMLIGRFRRAWFNQQPMPKSKKSFRFSFLFIFLLIFSASAIAQSGVTRNYFGNTWKNIGNGTVDPKRWGWINNGDSIGMFRDIGLDMRKPVLFARWTTAGRPSSPIAGMAGYNTDSSKFEFHDGAVWQQPGASSGGGGGVTSLASADNSLTLSGSTGAVDASLNVGHINTWSANQIYNTTTFKLKDADGSNHETWVLGTNHAFDRTVTWTLGDVNKTITMLGTVTIPNNFILTGNFAVGFTFSGTTSVTFPTTGTLATLAGTETFTNKTLTSPAINSAVTMNSIRQGNTLSYLLGKGTDSVVTAITPANLRTLLSLADANFNGTVSNETGVNTFDISNGRYTRNGAQVHMSGWVTCTPTSSGFQFNLSIPIASAFTTGNNGSGGANWIGSHTTTTGFQVMADSGADAILFNVIGAPTGSPISFWFYFDYEIL